jgi:outer membrane protein OmpA-like peptidoglycan-associated protein
MKAAQKLLRHWKLGSAGIGVMMLAQTVVGGFDNPLPVMTLNATRGLSQTSSGEAMGAGRLTFSLFGSWYPQKNEYPQTPNNGANIYTGNAAFSFGVNPFIDVFANVHMYALQNYDSLKSVGLGTVMAGVQGTLPFADTLPVRLGAQVLIFAGTSTNQINGNHADGYNYFETRQGYDFAGKLLQSVILGNEKYAFKMHFNEGLVSSLEQGKGLMMLLAAGIQVNAHPVIVLGVEANSRTFTDHISLLTDPLWVTPTICFRTPYFFNILVGADVALSKERDPTATEKALKALEPYRVFGAITFSFDLLARQKAAAKDKEKQDALEKERLKADADSLARLQKKESEEKTRAMAKADKQTQAERQRADSLARIADSLARKSRADSIALAESKRQTEEERSKRSDAEKQLLSTGLLLLDAVYFQSGRTDVNINSKPYLNIIGKMLTKYPKLVLEVGGHTDNVGGPSSNMRLSQARAESVRMYLISVAPELAGRLSATGYGPSQPKADNVSADGRQMNRRVELKVLNKDVLKEYNP